MRKCAIVFMAAFVAATLSTAARAERYDGSYRRGAAQPPPRHAVHGETYFTGHLGIFEPNDSSDGLRGYDSGSSFDLGIGSRVTPNLAIEGALGRYSASVGPNDVRVWPLTFGVRVILPQPVVEPYAGLGVGFYFADLDEPSSGIDDSDTTLGGNVSLGVDAWLNPRVALNFEGKYHFAEPTFDAVDVKVNGWSLGLGVRVAF